MPPLHVGVAGVTVTVALAVFPVPPAFDARTEYVVVDVGDTITLEAAEIVAALVQAKEVGAGLHSAVSTLDAPATMDAGEAFSAQVGGAGKGTATVTVTEVETPDPYPFDPTTEYVVVRVGVTLPEDWLGLNPVFDHE